MSAISVGFIVTNEPLSRGWSWQAGALDSARRRYPLGTVETFGDKSLGIEILTGHFFQPDPSRWIDPFPRDWTGMLVCC